MTKHHQIISVTDVCYQSWKTFIQHFFKFIFVTAIPLVVSYIFLWSTMGSFVFSVKTLPDPSQIFSASSGFIYFSIIAFVIITITQIWGTIAMLVATIYINDIKISEIFFRSLNYFWSFVILGILLLAITSIGMIAGYIIVMILGAIIGLFGQTVLNSAYVYLNIIPAMTGIVTAIFLIFAPYFLIEAKATPWTAVRKSYRLVKAYFLPIIIRLLIIYAFITTITFLLQFIPYVGQALAVFIYAPLLSIYLCALYLDLKPKV